MLRRISCGDAAKHGARHQPGPADEVEDAAGHPIPALYGAGEIVDDLGPAEGEGNAGGRGTASYGS